MDNLIKDSPFKIIQNTLQSEINHDLINPFLLLFNQIIVILRIFQTERQIEISAHSLWQTFVKDYIPMSSSGHLIVGKRKTDLEHTYFFWERTFDTKPENRIKEWKDREQKFSSICVDTKFGEQFSHAVLHKIRISRQNLKDDKKMEVEWFQMNEPLTWPILRSLLNEICIFVRTIKDIKGIRPIDINKATINEIEQLPLIGPKISKYIIEKRTEKLFTDFKDMKDRVPKLGDRIINAFKEFVIFNNDNQNQNQNQNLDNLNNQGNHLININTASINQLKSLPKIGKVLSENIIRQRAKQLFVNKEDIMQTHGIGPKIYDAIKDLITV